MNYDLDDLSFEEDTHTYLNPAGLRVPSVTQTLALTGVFDYSMVPPELLERKRIIGNNVHAASAEYDKAGCDTVRMFARLTDDERPYAEGWVHFVRDVRPRWIAIEDRMLRRIGRHELAGTPDRIAIVGRRAWVIDIKCSACKMAGWGLQTADYEMLHTRRASIGAMGRMIVRLSPRGTYNTLTFSDPSDAAAALAALACAHDPQDQTARDTIEAWKANNRIKERETWNGYRNEEGEEQQGQRSRVRPRDYDAQS